MLLSDARIVGDDDGGKLFTPEEYEKYKKKIIPQVENFIISPVRRYLSIL